MRSEYMISIEMSSIRMNDGGKPESLLQTFTCTVRYAWRVTSEGGNAKTFGPPLRSELATWVHEPCYNDIMKWVDHGV